MSGQLVTTGISKGREIVGQILLPNGITSFYERPALRAFHAVRDAMIADRVDTYLASGLGVTTIVNIALDLPKSALTSGFFCGWCLKDLAQEAYRKFDDASYAQDPDRYDGKASGTLDFLKRARRFATNLNLSASR